MLMEPCIWTGCKYVGPQAARQGDESARCGWYISICRAGQCEGGGGKEG